MVLLLLLLLLLGMSAGEIAISDDPRAQKIYEGFRMYVVQPTASGSTVSFSGLSASLVPPGTTARVSHRSGRPRSREPGRGALPTLSATHANNPCHTLLPRSDAINMRDATTGSLVWESDSVWCVAIIAV